MAPEPALTVDDAQIDRLLSDASALEAVETSFRLLSTGAAWNEPRLRTSVQGSTLNIMWALAPSLDLVCTKSYVVAGSRTRRGTAIVLNVFDHATGTLRAVLRGDRLGQIRTAAASALATRLLARPESTSLAVIGTGYQAARQARAVAAVLPQLRQIAVVGRDLGRARQFADELARDLSEVDVVVTDRHAAVGGADVVVTATSAREPVFDGRWLKPGTHVNAVGCNQPETCELDRHALDRAALITVDSHAVAARECGDILVHRWPVEQTVELGDVVAGSHPGRTDDHQITIFESQGLAIQDLVCAAQVVNRMEAGHR